MEAIAEISPRSRTLMVVFGLLAGALIGAIGYYVGLWIPRLMGLLQLLLLRIGAAGDIYMFLASLILTLLVVPIIGLGYPYLVGSVVGYATQLLATLVECYEKKWATRVSFLSAAVGYGVLAFLAIQSSGMIDITSRLSRSYYELTGTPWWLWVLVGLDALIFIIAATVVAAKPNYYALGLTAALEKGKVLSLNEADLSGVNLKGVGLKGVNLSKADLTKADLVEADLRETDLREAKLGQANLSTADLTKANLSEANLQEAQLAMANLSEANLSGANLSGANLYRTNLRGAKTDDKTQLDSKWRLVWEVVSRKDNSRLSETDLRGADLSGANLGGVNLDKLDLSEADLSEAWLAEASLSEANLSGANLRGANLGKASLSKANLQGARLSWTNLSGADVQEAKLNGANLYKANLHGADLRKADLRGAKLGRADLSEANLHDARYDGKTIWPGDFDSGQARAKGARLYHS